MCPIGLDLDAFKQCIITYTTEAGIPSIRKAANIKSKHYAI